MSHPYQQLIVARESEAIWRETFHNPPINMFDPDTLRDLHALVDAMEASADLKVVIFDSADPDFFIAHFDTSRAAETPTAPGPSGQAPWLDICLRLAAMPVVSIVSIRGRARGMGSEFSLDCDMRFASLEKAVLCQPEVAVRFSAGRRRHRAIAAAGRSRPRARDHPRRR